jgi:hypothetical protein
MTHCGLALWLWQTCPCNVVINFIFRIVGLDNSLLTSRHVNMHVALGDQKGKQGLQGLLLLGCQSMTTSSFANGTR